LGAGSLIIAIERGEEAGAAAEREGGAAADAEDLLLSAHYACTHCDRSYEPPSPQLFSFNSPQGMCLDCEGLGTRFSVDPDLLIPDSSLSFHEGAIPLVGRLRGMGRWRRHIYEGIAQTLGINLKTAWRKLPAEQRDLLLYGAGERHITYEWKQRGGSVWKHGG